MFDKFDQSHVRLVRLYLDGSISSITAMFDYSITLRWFDQFELISIEPTPAYIKCVDFIEFRKIEHTQFVLSGGKQGDFSFKELRKGQK